MGSWNVYEAHFVAECPADGEQIDYTVRIATRSMIRVEEINAHLSTVNRGFHEAIADDLHAKFGGMQVMQAVHQGVKILTMREDGDEQGAGEDWARGQVSAAVAAG